jgi:hypothetical protein
VSGSGIPLQKGKNSFCKGEKPRCLAGEWMRLSLEGMKIPAHMIRANVNSIWKHNVFANPKRECYYISWLYFEIGRQFRLTCWALLIVSSGAQFQNRTYWNSSVLFWDKRKHGGRGRRGILCVCMACSPGPGAICVIFRVPVFVELGFLKVDK